MNPPASPHAKPIPLKGATILDATGASSLSPQLKAHVPTRPVLPFVDRGIPFACSDGVLLIESVSLRISLDALKTPWLVFLHTTDHRDIEINADGFTPHGRGKVHLGLPVGKYILEYDDGTESSQLIKQRHHISMVSFPWGEGPMCGFISSQSAPGRWVNTVWAWENPHPDRVIKAMRIEPQGWPIIISAITAVDVGSEPLRWETRRKAILSHAAGDAGFPALDMGQVISTTPRQLYPHADWAATHNNQLAHSIENEWILEYASHADACFHFPDGSVVPVKTVEKGNPAGRLTVVKPSTQRVRIRIIDAVTRKPVAVKLHLHGESGEYLPPEARARLYDLPQNIDDNPDFRFHNRHHCTYIDGDTSVWLPLGKVYLEVAKGFEVEPIRRTLRITASTRTITISIKHILPWRDRGWVTADTHVHFLPPSTALLEGAAEGVNVVNLLASQWTERMTNVGDFDGKTTLGSGTEYMVRVGTENRQPVLGHISLLGYEGPMILPLCSGGPEEAAQGDPAAILLSEWAAQCRKQKGLVVLPHFPNPRCEQAAVITRGLADAVEMCEFGNPWGGISAYSLSDWYRYLNCGWFTPVVAGTDKMSQFIPVGAMRTYAKLGRNKPFTYENWMHAVRTGNTFATVGPLIEFSVEGHVPGQPLKLTRNGGVVSVEWNAASVTIPMTRVELVAGGEIVEGQAVMGSKASGVWKVSIKRSTWLALLVRGQFPGQQEIIAAHSSPVMIPLAGRPYSAHMDAMTILEQIEGAIAHLDTVAPRADVKRHKQMRLTLTSAHRQIHNRLHRMGVYHNHTHATDHPEHHA